MLWYAHLIERIRKPTTCEMGVPADTTHTITKKKEKRPSKDEHNPTTDREQRVDSFCCCQMSLSITPHPHGVLPEGNLFLLGSASITKANQKRNDGLGPMLSKLDDTTLIKALSYSGSSALAALCSTSDTLHAFASFEVTLPLLPTCLSCY